jgi:hypothetical protein
MEHGKRGPALGWGVEWGAEERWKRSVRELCGLDVTTIAEGAREWGRSKSRSRIIKRAWMQLCLSMIQPWKGRRRHRRRRRRGHGRVTCGLRAQTW